MIRSIANWMNEWKMLLSVSRKILLRVKGETLRFANQAKLVGDPVKKCFSTLTRFKELNILPLEGKKGPRPFQRRARRNFFIFEICNRPGLFFPWFHVWLISKIARRSRPTIEPVYARINSKRGVVAHASRVIRITGESDVIFTWMEKSCLLQDFSRGSKFKRPTPSLCSRDNGNETFSHCPRELLDLTSMNHLLKWGDSGATRKIDFGNCASWKKKGDFKLTTKVFGFRMSDVLPFSLLWLIPVIFLIKDGYSRPTAYALVEMINKRRKLK